MVAHVFEKQHAAIRKGFALGFRLGADAIGSEFNRLPQQLSQAGGHRRQAVLRIDFALGAAEMRSEHESRAALDGQTKRRQRFADARIVRNARTFERHVEIHADENALAGQIEIANR